MNSVANGKIYLNTEFKKIYIPASAGDAGGAIGSAYSVWHKNGGARISAMSHAYYGNSVGNADIEKLLTENENQLRQEECEVYTLLEEELCERTAYEISEGNVVGWFQGRMEWGPRALGNRSILGDPRRANMKDILNAKIKRRESFRPFAPSILREHVSLWFEQDDEVPFMMQVFQISEDKRNQIPAVTHVDGSGRLQTVEASNNKLYYKLIKAFFDLTNVPIVLNTSFNENEPIVSSAQEAFDCFMRTKMDVLVLGNSFIKRKET